MGFVASVVGIVGAVVAVTAGSAAARQQEKQAKDDEIPFFHGSSSFSDWIGFQSVVLFRSVDDQNLFRYYCIISGSFCQYFTNQFSDAPFKSAI